MVLGALEVNPLAGAHVRVQYVRSCRLGIVFTYLIYAVQRNRRRHRESL